MGAQDAFPLTPSARHLDRGLVRNIYAVVQEGYKVHKGAWWPAWTLGTRARGAHSGLRIVCVAWARVRVCHPGNRHNVPTISPWLIALWGSPSACRGEYRGRTRRLAAEYASRYRRGSWCHTTLYAPYVSRGLRDSPLSLRSDAPADGNLETRRAIVGDTRCLAGRAI